MAMYRALTKNPEHRARRARERAEARERNRLRYGWDEPKLSVTTTATAVAQPFVAAEGPPLPHVGPQTRDDAATAPPLPQGRGDDAVAPSSQACDDAAAPTFASSDGLALLADCAAGVLA
jgi:hypothetical protein